MRWNDKAVLEVTTGGIALLLWLLKPARKDRISMAPFREYDYAHRGYHNITEGIPENSMKAFQRAVERGYGMEMDVHLTKDDKLVVVHDDNLKRLCGVDKCVADCTWEELASFQLLGTEERIPSLSEVLALVDGRTPLIIELKTEKGNYDKLCREACAMLDSYRGLWCMESFDPRTVRWLKQNRPDIIRGQLLEHFRRHGTMIHPAHDFLGRNLFSNFLTKPDFIAYQYKDRECLALRLVKKLYRVQEVSWTVKDRKTARRLKKEGCMIIFENY